MSDLTQLEQEILGGAAAAGDEASLEAVRIAALGKSGSVSALLKTLGGMTPDERRTQRRGDQPSQGSRHRRHRRAQGRAQEARRSTRG